MRRHLKKYISILCFFVLHLVLNANAQRIEIPDAGELQTKLQKLNVLGSVLYVAAHPDDENTAALAYFSKGKKYRTAYLSLTRGDGGQNLIGPEKGAEIGIIRTQELLAARRIDGAEQFFTRAIDFGYSKTPEETLEFWGKEEILSDLVWVIRKFRPDVIITRFTTDASSGHGHHTASGWLIKEAFHAACSRGQLKDCTGIAGGRENRKPRICSGSTQVNIILFWENRTRKWLQKAGPITKVRDSVQQAGEGFSTIILNLSQDPPHRPILLTGSTPPGCVCPVAKMWNPSWPMSWNLMILDIPLNPSRVYWTCIKN